MKAVQKRMIAAGCVGLLLICVAAKATEKETYAQKSEKADRQALNSESLETSQTEWDTQDKELTFWYADASYSDFFEQAAKEYYEDTGIRVQVCYQSTMDYLKEIYDATMNDDAFPDIYMLGSDQLESAYLYGLAAENLSGDIYESSVAANANRASSYHDKMYAYPLSYSTCLFAYQNGYFEEKPASIQSIIDVSAQMEQPENVQYLLEWNVNDAFYDFPFISNSVSFVKDEVETMQVDYDQTLYDEDLEFFAQILESFSIDASSVTEESVISDFKEGKTICAILSSDAVAQLEGCDYSLTELLPLNDTLEAKSAALTDLVVVNDFSEEKKKAADFAEYVTLTMAEELHGLSGHYSVKLSEDADEDEKISYDAYENSVPVPDSQDAREFWVTLKETISQYF